jgi:integrating conjugative element membrane protein (TIGR03747 family)
MSDAAATAQRQQQQQKSIFNALITLPFRFTAVLLGSLLLSIIIECVGTYALWPEEGWKHARQMYKSEQGQLSDNFKRSAIVQEPGRTVHELVQLSYGYVMVKSGLEKSLKGTSRKAHKARTRNVGDTSYYVGELFVHLENYLLAAAYTILVFIIRLIVLFLSLPLFLIAAFLGLIDGLVCRDIRRFGAGRESGYLYHRAKACVLPLATLPWIFYLSLPMSVEAGLILVPSAILLGLAIAITARSFKKYL